MVKNILLSFSMIILMMTFSGCSRNKIHSYNKTYPANVDDTDKFLIDKKFDISTDSNKRIVYIASPESDENIFDRYEISNNGIINVNVELGKKFVISLHANRTIAYEWNIKNNIDNSILNFEKKTKFYVPVKNKEKSIGMDYSRQNFHFKSLNKGNQNIVLMYEHIGSSRPDYFKITINVNVK